MQTTPYSIRTRGLVDELFILLRESGEVKNAYFWKESEYEEEEEEEERLESVVCPRGEIRPRSAAAGVELLLTIMSDVS